MSKETIGYKPIDLAQMPEVRQNFIEARIIPPLDLKDMALNQATDKELDLIVFRFKLKMYN